MYNKTIVAGNVGKDPEMRYTPSGVPVTSFSLATTKRWKDQDGAPREETTWFRVTAWRKLAETCNQYVHRGMRVLVDGTVKASAWLHKETGEPRASLELTANSVVFLSKKDEGRDGADQHQQASWDEEEIPF